MKDRRWTSWLVVAALVAGALFGGAVMAFGSSESDQPEDEVQGPEHPQGPLLAARRRHPALIDVVHGDLELLRVDGSSIERTFDRGEIVEVSDTALTIERPDGEQVSFEINDETVVRIGFVLGERDDLETGDRVMVFSLTDDEGSQIALAVRCVEPPDFHE
jgi:hypothetical protein